MLSIITSVLTAAATIPVLVTVFFKRSWRYWKLKNVESPPAEFFFGHVKNLILQRSSYGEVVSDIYKKYKHLPYTGFYFFFKPVLMINDLELVKSIFTKDFHHFTDHGFYVNEESDPLTGHLFSLNGQKWRNLRAKLTPTFTSGKMKRMFPILVSCSKGLVSLMDSNLDRNGPVEIKDMMGRYATDIIGSCAFGIESDSLKNPDSEFRQCGSKIFEFTTVGSLKNLIGIVLPKLLLFFNAKIVRNDVTDYIMQLVHETVNYREVNNVQRNDFMNLLIQLKNSGKIDDDDDDSEKKNVNTTISMNELAAQVFVFFAAGFETSSSTLTFCTYELAQEFEVQNKLRQEVNDVLNKYNGELTYEALNDMVYMDQCINETLRKYPPVPILNRLCTMTYKVPGSDLVIEKDTLLHVPVMGIQRDPEIYPDPLKFDPERFSAENKLLRHPFAWLPFGEGPRLCIGLRFALMQIKVALTVLLKNYNFSLSEKTKSVTINPKLFNLSVEDGMWLNVEKIDS